MKPLLKWVGGKTRAMKHNVLPFLPTVELETGEITRYVEPFVGSGAVFLRLVEEYPDLGYAINDNNPDLMRFYRSIQFSHRFQERAFVGVLNSILRTYFQCVDEPCFKQGYNSLRFYFNQDRRNLVSREYAADAHTLSAMFFILMRLAYSGLYRVNKSGDFNTPFGGAQHIVKSGEYLLPLDISKFDFEALGRCLGHAELYHQEYDTFLQAMNTVGGTMFIYVDPPYFPYLQDRQASMYSVQEFSLENQKCLAEQLTALAKDGHYILVNNAYPEWLDIQEYYPEDVWTIYPVKIQHVVRKGQPVERREVAIVNYEL